MVEVTVVFADEESAWPKDMLTYEKMVSTTMVGKTRGRQWFVFAPPR